MPVITKMHNRLRIPAGQMIFTASQVWTVPHGVRKIDVFCVGGGGSGRTGNIAFFGSDTDKNEGAGGGGGYTSIVFNASVTPGQSIAITVGAGGAGGRLYIGNDGSPSSFGSICTAYGGKGASGDYRGADGGSGGGINYMNWESYPLFQGYGTAGASDGGSVIGSVSTSEGQGTTTRSFGEASGTLYSGGGGGCSAAYNDYPGGAGGGGKSGSKYTSAAGSGTPNTGGGGGGGHGGPWSDGQGSGDTAAGGGGSGIVIVRWSQQ